MTKETGAASSNARVRVLTLNLWGLRGRWPERRTVLAAGLADAAPDLIAFQEAVTRDAYDQVTDLVGAGFHIVHQRQREHDGQGVAIASRWPLLNVEEVDLEVTGRTKDFACTTLVAEVAAPSAIGPLLFVNHLPNWRLHHERERELQAVAAARRVEDRVRASDAQVVLAGDFDATPDSASLRFWTGRQSLDGLSVSYQDAWECAHPDRQGFTLLPENPLVRQGSTGHWAVERGRRMDYVLVRCRDEGTVLDVRSCTRVFDRPREGVWASDHCGVLADLALFPAPG